MSDFDTETRDAVAALVFRLRNRGGETGRFAVDDELFAAEFVAALKERGWMPDPALPADPGQGDGTREASRELLAFARATRPDWSAEETWAAVHAAKTAGLDWDKLALRLMGIALREEDPPTKPRELWNFARGITSKAAGQPPAPGYLAVKAARGWMSATGGQEVLREGHDP